MAKLQLVSKPTDVIDLYTPWREEIASRDWSNVHIKGDRNKPVDLPFGKRRGWR